MSRTERLGKGLVDEDHEDEGQGHEDHDDLHVQVLLDPGDDLGLAGRLPDVADRAFEAGLQVLAHLVEGVAGADEHAADGDRPDDELPDVRDHVDPVDVGRRDPRPIESRDELGPEEEHQQGGEEAPGQEAAGEVEGREAGSDDVADADVGGEDAGPGDGHGAAGPDRRRILGGAQPDETGSDLADLEDEVLAGGEELDDAERVEEGPEPHGLEEELRALAALLPGLVDLGRGDGFGEDQVGIGDHDPAEEGDEEDAEQAADEHQGRGLDVGVEGVEVRPGARDDEGGDGEDGPGGDRFADGADRPGDVLLEDRALHDLQDGHADDGRGIGGRDGHAGPEAEVGVGRAEDDGQNEADEDGPKREFLHVRFFGDVGLRTQSALLSGKSD